MGVLADTVRVCRLTDVSRVLRITRLALIMAFQSSLENSPSHEPAETPTPGHNKSTSGRTAIALIISHAAISATFAIIAGKPRRRWDNLAFLIIMSANSYIAIPLSSLATLAAFAYQIRHGNSESATGGKHSPKALSTWVLALQVALFLSLALFWPSRLTLPRNLRHGDWWLLTEWYPQVGWACVNNAVFAAGSILLLYVELGVGSEGSERPPGERQALLS